MTLDEERRDIRRRMILAGYGWCGYCYQLEPGCRPIQVRAHNKDSWCNLIAGASCRDYLRGVWRHNRGGA